MDYVNMDEYKEDVRRTALLELPFKEYLGWAALGLGAEAGELLNVIKKNVHQGHDLDIAGVTDELGDVFFYMAAIMDKLSISLTDVLAVNVGKRLARYPEGFKAAHSINGRLDHEGK